MKTSEIYKKVTQIPERTVTKIIGTICIVITIYICVLLLIPEKKPEIYTQKLKNDQEHIKMMRIIDARFEAQKKRIYELELEVIKLKNRK